MENITVKFKRIHEDAVIPKYAIPGDAGMDIRSINNYELKPGERTLIHTGLKIQLPIGYEAQVRPKSGLAIKHGLSIVNSPGTIDSGYRGEIGVILINHGTDIYKINKGERIAQLVIARHESPTIEEVLELEDSQRGENGFGSTGK